MCPWTLEDLPNKYTVIIGLSPCPVTVTTRIVMFSVGDPYKPSFATVTGRGQPKVIINNAHFCCTSYDSWRVGASRVSWVSSIWYGNRTPFTKKECWYTLPKTKSSVLKISRKPKGKDHLPTVGYQTSTVRIQQLPESLKMRLVQVQCLDGNSMDPNTGGLFQIVFKLCVSLWCATRSFTNLYISFMIYLFI